jgi:hypothetical protein
MNVRTWASWMPVEMNSNSAGSFERSVTAPVPYKTRRLLMLLGLASLGLQHNLNDNTLVASVPRAGRRAPTDAPAQGPAR